MNDRTGAAPSFIGDAKGGFATHDPNTHFVQPKITGYRQLSMVETELMNRIKAAGIELEVLVNQLRGLPPTTAAGPMMTDHGPTIDQRWVSIGATHLQQGLMALTRGVAQPTTF
jgi:hypothetical protein